MKIANKEFDLKNNIYMMGILNVTPDSFSDGGKFNNETAAIEHVNKLIEDGADIIDVGGESTRPGYEKIEEKEEIKRTANIIKKIKENFDIPVSIDSYKPNVVKECLEAGADLVNDIWGFKYDKKMAEIVAKYKVPVCLMHNRKEAVYNNFLEDVKNDLKESITIAKDYGIEDDKIILDPGVGFAKNYEENLLIIKNLDLLLELNYPILLGTSRKSVIGLTLDLPVNEREEGTIATSVIGAMKGACIFRVHDVKKNIRALKMTKAIMEVKNI